MMTNWRLITDDGVTASFGLAADDCLAQRVGREESPPTLRLYTYRSHCALIGRFQNVDNEVRRDYCAAHGIAVNRRPTGGGAIIMGADQLGVALTLPGRSDDAYSRARELMVQFSAGVVNGLRTLGVDASFCHKNDVEVGGARSWASASTARRATACSSTPPCSSASTSAHAARPKPRSRKFPTRRSPLSPTA